MKTKHYIALALIPLALLFSGCETHAKHATTQAQKKETAYVDSKGWAQGRLCDKLLWKCLPESNDTKRWQKPLKNRLDSFELTPEVLEKSKRLVNIWMKRYDAYHSKKHPKGEKEPMLITALDKRFLKSVARKKFLVEMEESLAKEFPGFWRDVPKKVRYRWIQRAMNKAKKFGYDPKQNNQMVELCARIGLDFDKDPKWDYITKFIALKEDNIGTANDYLDFTVFESDYSLQNGDKFTDWYLREAFPYLPKPKRPLPKLNN